jgi:GntR family transcriptional regulator
MEAKLPEYKRIANIITQRIHRGEYPSFTYLPSENELAVEFAVTRTTIRKALNILKQQGTIESFQGKGYRVSSLYWEQSLLKFYSFGRDIASRLERTETELISCRQTTGLQDVEEFKDERLWEITRARKVEDLPLILETSYIPQKFLPGLDKRNLVQSSLYNLLEEAGVHIIKAKEYLEPVLPSIEAYRLLDLKEDLPLFQTTRYTYDNRDRMVEFRESLIRSDRFRFSVELYL